MSVCVLERNTSSSSGCVCVCVCMCVCVCVCVCACMCVCDGKFHAIFLLDLCVLEKNNNIIMSSSRFQGVSEKDISSSSLSLSSCLCARKKYYTFPRISVCAVERKT